MLEIVCLVFGLVIGGLWGVYLVLVCIDEKEEQNESSKN